MPNYSFKKSPKYYAFLQGSCISEKETAFVVTQGEQVLSGLHGNYPAPSLTSVFIQ